MAVSSLGDFSAEILVQICECLERTHPPSLVALARTSKSCYSVAATFLFRSLRVSIVSSSRLKKDIQLCYDALQRAASFKHVRLLAVFSSAQSEFPTDFEPQYEWHWPRRTHGAIDEIDAEGTIHTNNNIVGNDGFQDEAWQPLSELMQQLPRLADFVYGCSAQIPPCLLRVLEERPDCRLHMNTFKLRSLNHAALDAGEKTLATSPNLYSIRLRYDETGGFDSYGNQSNDLEAAMRLAQGLAPNLKKVTVVHVPAGAGLYSSKPATNPWTQSPFDQSSTVCQSGSLESLHLVDHTMIGLRTIKEWKAHTDFALLDTLKLEGANHEEALDFLANQCRIPSLQTLSLDLDTRVRHQPASLFNAADRFLSSLPGLSTLKLRGELDHINLQSLLSHHGKTLRQLLFLSVEGTSFPTAQDILVMTDSCPQLEDLVLKVRRSQGDANEIDIYKTLGGFVQLKYLNLTLDASDYAVLSEDNDPDNSRFDDFDQQSFPILGALCYPCYGHVREAFINGALDARLASAIFSTISSAKPVSAASLEAMKVKVTGAGRFGQLTSATDLDVVTGELAQSWLVQRSPRDDSRNELIVSELANVDGAAGKPTETRRLRSHVEAIFRKLWPARQAGGDWRKDWHSFPLSSD